MFYHSRPLDFVRYGKVEPPPVDVLDPDFARAYRWLGRYCGFYPQVWLSRSRSAITGFRPSRWSRAGRDGILFGFEAIKGFPVYYEVWCLFLNPLLNARTDMDTTPAVIRLLDDLAADPDTSDDRLAVAWSEDNDLRSVLDRHLFVEHDQVVLPTLNLKAAKTIVCRNERQKKALRRMGFIEDRIVIQNMGR